MRKKRSKYKLKFGLCLSLQKKKLQPMRANIEYRKTSFGDGNNSYFLLWYVP